MPNPKQPEVPETLVEMLAERLYQEGGIDRPAALTWSATTESVREMYRQDARAHLAVIVPALRKQAQEEERERLRKWAGEFEARIKGRMMQSEDAGEVVAISDIEWAVDELREDALAALDSEAERDV